MKLFRPKDCYWFLPFIVVGCSAMANAQGSSPNTPVDWWFQLFASWLPMLLLIGVWIFFMKKVAGKKGSDIQPGGSSPDVGRDAKQLDRIEQLLEEILKAVKKGK